MVITLSGNKKRILSLLFLMTIFISSFSLISGYYCIEQEDNIQVKQFKSNMNMVAFEQEIEKGITKEAFNLKIQIFNGCE